LGLHVQPAPVKVVLAGTVSVSVVEVGLPPESVTVRWYTSTSLGPTWVVGPAGVPLSENRVFTVSSTATVGVVTAHDEQVPVDEVTVLTIVVVAGGRVAATVTSNGTVVELLAATVTSWMHVPSAASLGVQVQPVPVKVVLAGTVSVRVVVPGVPPPLVTVRLYTSTSFGPTSVDGPAGVVVPAGVVTDARVFTVSSTATVGVVTAHDEQVPVDEVTVLAMVVVPAGKLAATVTVNDTGTVAPTATVRF
jgi:hypothetical protein